jgi:cytidine deaminase
MEIKELYKIAQEVINPQKLRKFGESGHVSCALETPKGKIFTGICIDVPCSIGFCAEYAAIAEMLKSGETTIKKIIAVFKDGTILPPCGRCREFMLQLDDENAQTLVVLPDMKTLFLKDLLPKRWDD